MQIIPIKIRGKLAMYNAPCPKPIVKDNTDYIVQFDLSESDFTEGRKYLVVITGDGQDDPVPFTGNTCALRAFGSRDGNAVQIGIYEGDLSTTTSATIRLTDSILSLDVPSSEPEPADIMPIIDDADDITDEDTMYIIPIGGVKSFVTIAVLKELFGEGGGGGSGGGGENEIFDVYYNRTTYSEVAEAYSDGKALRLHYDDALSQTATMWLAYVQGSGRDLPTFYFFGWGDVYYIRRISLTESGWSGALSFELASAMELAGKQDALTAGTGITIAYEGEGLSRVLKIFADLAQTVDALTSTKAPTNGAVISYVADQLSGLTVPTKVSELQNDSGFVNASGAASAAPVQSVNGQTGNVNLTIPQPLSPSTSNPAMDGTASAGSSSAYARGDHVHPTDTSRQSTANLVTALSSASTDAQYPSAKCVYDAIIGAIEEAY